MKERLLGDFSRKNLNLDNIFDKVLDSEKLIAKNFSIPRRFSRRVLDSEKITSISIGTVALVVGCGTSRTYEKGITKSQEVSVRREEEDAMSSLLAQRHKLLFRAKVILWLESKVMMTSFRITQHCVAQRHVA